MGQEARETPGLERLRQRTGLTVKSRTVDTETISPDTAGGLYINLLSLKERFLVKRHGKDTGRSPILDLHVHTFSCVPDRSTVSVKPSFYSLLTKNSGTKYGQR